MHALKRVEVEVFRLLAEIQGEQISTRMDEIDPGQFYGIEVKMWAREIAELTLWIGFHQFWRQQQHGVVQPVEPLLRDTGTIECRDAVLAWDAIVHRPETDRLDPTPRIVHPVTGQWVPDPSAKLKYWEYVGARQAEWPESDFIVGNLPFLGQARQRDAFGDGYVEALRRVYSDVADSVDFVMYWWHRAATAAANRQILRAGLITTSSLIQVWNRETIAKAISAGARVVWAIPDHPWVDESGSADVRVAMTVITAEPIPAVRFTVGSDGAVLGQQYAIALNSDLTAHADVATTARVALKANDGICAQGMGLRGSGFLLERDEADRLVAAETSNAEILKPYLNGRDVASRPRDVYVIDFGLMDERRAREFPMLFDIVRARVKPDRDAHARESLRRYWWRFGWPRGELRSAISGLERFVITVGTAKHRFFTFLPVSTTPDEKLVCIATGSAFFLGALSSRVHQAWALATGGRLGVGNDPVYVKSAGFDAFPFPEPISEVRDAVAGAAERLDAHRKSAIARDEHVTMTGMYNVVAKLRSGEALTPKERTIHELAACGVLRDIHDELDALVAQAYGWPWPMSDAEILDRLVALHDVRVEEEKQGIIRWLRPEFQAPGQPVTAPPTELSLATTTSSAVVVADAIVPWPAEAVEQIGALKRLASAGAVSVDDASARFNGAKREIVARHLETLAILGEVRVLGDGTYGAAAAA